MNASQSLRTAFWSLTVGFGLLLLLFGFRPNATETETWLGRSINGTDVGESRFDDAASEAAVTAQLNIDQRFPAITDDRWEQPAERNSQSAVIAQRVSESRPPTGDFSRGPLIQLETIEEVDNGPETVADAPQQSTVSFDRELNARLTSLQTAVERLQQSQSERRANNMERTAHLRKLTQQSQQLQELELQLQRLQAAEPATSEDTRSAAETKQPDATIDAAPVRIDLYVQHAEITEVLKRLGQANGYNIVIGEGVDGTIPLADLRDVSVVEAIDDICRLLGLAFERDGRFIYVMTKAEHAARKAKAAKASAKN